MVSVQECRAEKSRTNNQEGIVFFAIEANQRYAAHDESQKSSERLHKRMQLFAALPWVVAKEYIRDNESQTDQAIREKAESGNLVDCSASRHAFFPEQNLPAILRRQRVV